MLFLRRWPNIETALGEYPVFAENRAYFSHLQLGLGLTFLILIHVFLHNTLPLNKWPLDTRTRDARPMLN